jgi:hypothetical protein
MVSHLDEAEQTLRVRAEVALHLAFFPLAHCIWAIRRFSVVFFTNHPPFPGHNSSSAIHLFLHWYLASFPNHPPTNRSSTTVKSGSERGRDHNERHRKNEDLPPAPPRRQCGPLSPLLRQRPLGNRGARDGGYPGRHPSSPELRGT